MAATEHPMQALANYLPNNSFPEIVQYLNYYKVHLTVTKKRKTVLGDYRNTHMGSNHRISINGNLNKYEFLITLLHELAHLLTFEKYGNKVESHGKEWKHQYSSLLVNFVNKNIFPASITIALQKSIINPSATANGEIELLRVLRQYTVTEKHPNHTTIEQLQDGTIFTTDNGKIYKKLGKRRKRYMCIEIKTGLYYSFSAISEVKIVVNNTFYRCSPLNYIKKILNQIYNLFQIIKK